MKLIKTGFDPISAIKIEDRKVTRKINEAEREKFKKLKIDLHNLIKEKSLVRFAVKRTTVCSERLPLIYPYEWPCTAFFDALKFHISFCRKVLKSGWYVKDFLLSNVVFDKTKPVFVDLGSFQVSRQSGAVKENFCSTYCSMMFPYALLPAFAFLMGKNKLARSWLSNRFCNTRSRPPSLQELLNNQAWIKIRIKKLLFTFCQNTIKILPLQVTLSIIYKILSRIKFKLTPSAYTSYYENKDIGPSKKDTAVKNVLKTYKPGSVIDLGSNTGKYSFLAAKTAKVVYAIEEDECCADIIYQKIKNTESAIVTILKSFEDFDKPVFANGSLYGLKKDPSLFYPLSARIQGDLVLFLGLIHHLCLGRGLSFQKIHKTIGKICRKYVLTEFVDLKDPLIQNETSFFPAYQQKMFTYSKSKFLNSLKPKFKLIKTLPSDSPTRTLYLIKKIQ